MMDRSLAVLIGMLTCGSAFCAEPATSATSTASASSGVASSQSASAGEVGITADAAAVQISLKGQPVLKYLLKKPADSACVSPSACYFHPLTTPSGVVITDVAPDDHLHHRGVFLAWLEVRDAVTAGDFWGWGKPAPVEGRVIRHVDTPKVAATGDSASFTVRNTWQAESAWLLAETLSTRVTFRPEARVHDLSYEFKSQSDATLGRYAFSGFSVRTRKDAPITVQDPAGPVTLPAPSHLKPETDWPDRPWYAFEMSLPDGKKAGVAVLNHPANPATLWHNVTKIGLLNPCIVAPGPVALQAGKPLALRYQVVTFDGAVPTALLNELAETFGKTPAVAGGRQNH